MEVFGHNDAVPFVKMLQFFRKEPFSMKAYYKGHIPYPDPLIGKASSLLCKQTLKTAIFKSCRVTMKTTIKP